MRIGKRWISWAALWVAAGTFATSASGQGITLAHTNVISGNHSGYVVVDLPVAATIDATQAASKNRSLHFTGTGPFAGVLLRPSAEQGLSGPAILAARFDRQIFCSGTCAASEDYLAVMPLAGANLAADAITVPAGSYRLYLLTNNGDAAAVTITLDGLPEGTTQLAPTVPVPVAGRALPRQDSSPSPNVAVFGATDTLATRGILLSVRRGFFGPRVGHLGETCFPSAAVANPFAFYPGCSQVLGNGDLDPTVRATTAPESAALFTAVYGQEAGNYGIGGNTETAGQVDSLGWAGAWISLD